MNPISVAGWYHACQPFLQVSPTERLGGLYAQNLIDFLILYNAWRGLDYGLGGLVLTLLGEWRIYIVF